MQNLTTIIFPDPARDLKIVSFQHNIFSLVAFDFTSATARGRLKSTCGVSAEYAFRVSIILSQISLGISSEMVSVFGSILPIVYLLFQSVILQKVNLIV